MSQELEPKTGIRFSATLLIGAEPKGKARRSPTEGSKLQKIRRLRALRRQIAPPIYAPTGRFGRGARVDPAEI
jgi:hypothetical protein